MCRVSEPVSVCASVPEEIGGDASLGRYHPRPSCAESDIFDGVAARERFGTKKKACR